MSSALGSPTALHKLPYVLLALLTGGYCLFFWHLLTVSPNPEYIFSDRLTFPTCYLALSCGLALLEYHRRRYSYWLAGVVGCVVATTLLMLGDFSEAPRGLMGELAFLAALVTSLRPPHYA